MSSKSIARQNRRLKQKQLPPIRHSDSSDPQILSSASSFEPYGSHSDTYENSSDKLDRGSVTDEGSNIESKGKEASEVTGCSFINCDVSSRPIGKIFIEEERGFKAIDACHMFQSLHNENLSQTTSKSELAIDLACKATKCFHRFSFLCHGFLGGISLIETMLLVHLILSHSGQEETLKQFQFLSEPVHNIFNFLCIICCISAFDRYDIGNLKQLFTYVKKCKVKLIVIIIYPLCFLLSLSTANVDEKLCLPEQNATLIESFHGAENELFYWKVLSISKCVGAIIGWLIISVHPNNNLFLTYMTHIQQRSKK